MTLTSAEHDVLRSRLGRALSEEEEALFTGMWSEHCSYKSTRELVAGLPSRGPSVVAGPGGHAGVVDVGDGLQIAFKIESHNHPSAVEPFQGAATGVGGVLRDVIAAGARPMCILSGLAFAAPRADSTQVARADRAIETRVIDGIAAYGNAIGVAHVGGTYVHSACFSGSPLVNVLALGWLRRGTMRTAQATTPGDAVFLVGARTGPDGMHGAAFASRVLGDASAERHHVQVGDPFAGRKLLEAALAIGADAPGAVAGVAIRACQDLGAAGIACAISELASRGGRGIEVNLDMVPLRDPTMSAAAILLSESQERFVFVVPLAHAEAFCTHFERSGVTAACIGAVVEDDCVRVHHRGKSVVDVPATLVTDGCPRSPPRSSEHSRRSTSPLLPRTDAASLLDTIGAPAHRSRRTVFDRFDQTVGAATAAGPEQASAAVLVLPDSTKGIAISLTAGVAIEHAGDARLAARDAALRAVRDVACVGAVPLALTDGINASAPEVPSSAAALRGLFEGLRDAATGLSLPFVSGNVSLYNAAGSETVFVGCVGVLDDARDALQVRARPGATLLVVRREADYDVQSDLRFARVMPSLARNRVLLGARAVGRAGALLSLAKLCVATSLGATLTIRADVLGETRALALLLVETPGHEARVRAAFAREALRVDAIGTMGGTMLAADGSAALAVSELRARFLNVASIP